MKLSAIITKENNLFVALCPELNIASQGDNEKEALLNLKEAVELFLEDEDSKEVIKNIYPAKMFSLEITA
ncbi:MAG: type II toxin-antitoxin system HicB family antitoxin [archaeon]|jgi:predicted RNase H-like HicB family nuclease|nr:type II toxin-antitoxin system HicB family antitoxin [archaeon]MDD2477496.1 type II toxin-antitoxin system HicB family antitoxin [Candidatus ainarchaeum sp.]MDD3084760.1 type II toxin-antitoxin system HicB family antitoxin [Candidatus ainarchaeum sp.]MDD4221436.1 type II toxin-antitoxin system HicB family antitoxin [Candidatus ainarchaeum sp.]MDD4662401.1 type II toxin-antitoxin system HicB family antitoxin [Candidatus ainarchaeum sp.]